MLCGCTTTSICFKGISKSQCASIISNPLFIIVAESTVILLPILQLGCLSAISGVTPLSFSAEKPKKGPPLAVRTSLETSPLPRHCQTAECSLSTGNNADLLFTSASLTKAPPQTKVSLLASATSTPFSIAFRTARSAAIPLVATRITSKSSSATFSRHSLPKQTPLSLP